MPIEFSLEPPQNPEQPGGQGTLEANNSRLIEMPLLEEFLSWAQAGNWEAFDSKVLEICNDQQWMDWTDTGLLDPRIDVRDLAISILEKTHHKLTQKLTQLLKKSFLNLMKLPKTISS